MCYQIIERYSVCRCLYHKHSVDPCRQYRQEHHRVTEKTVLIGFACARHSVRRRRENLFEIPFIPPYPEACHDIGYNASIAETNSSLKSSNKSSLPLLSAGSVKNPQSTENRDDSGAQIQSHISKMPRSASGQSTTTGKLQLRPLSRVGFRLAPTYSK
jgi:hypothetical protein